MNSANSRTGDELATFHLPVAGVRGVHVALDAAWREIATKEPYPDAVLELLGQATAAAAMLTAHVKVEGRLSVQFKGQAGLRTLFAECTAAGTLRAIAQMDEPGSTGAGSRANALMAGGLLAITVENPGRAGGEPVRYQGLVSVESERLDHAFERYFDQSEQLPTRMLLAATPTRAVGLMLQKLPGDAGDDDGWHRSGLLLDTLSTGEMLDTDRPLLLHRLFHEENLVQTAARTLRFGCSCSRARVEAMLVALGPEEARAAAETGAASIRCEFCATTYAFTPAEIEALFDAPGSTVPAPPGTQ